MISVEQLRSWLVVSSVLACVLGGQGAVRDGGLRPAVPGTGVLAGVVVSADAAKTPIRRVTVTLNGGDVTNVLAVTDDDGRFVFRNLPPGRYTLSAARPGFVTASFGATKPGRAGTAIALAGGQQITDVSIPLLRGGVISGVITDETGEPARDVRVSAVMIVRSSASGQRTYQLNLRSGEAVDDRGAFRLYGLAPGDYVVAAALNRPGAGVRETSEAEFQRAMQPVRVGGGAAAVGTPVPSPGGPAPIMGAAPVFFPGTLSGADAQVVHLGPAEELSGISFAVRLAPTGRINGSVVGPDGQPAPGMAVRLTARGRVPVISAIFFPSSATSDREGKFIISGVPPGTYSLSVQPTAALSGRGGAAGGAPMLWAQTELTTDGRDTEASLVLRAGVSVAGAVVFESHGVLTPPADASRLKVAMQAVLAEGEYALFGLPTTADSAGAFTFAGVTPGRYRFQVTAPGGTPSNPGWFVKSATLQGRDVIDTPLAVSSDDVAGVVVTLTDRPIELSGMMQDASGQPAPEYFLIAFPKDRALWIGQSPRIQQTRPGADGTFLFRGLLPGEYLVAAVTDIQTNEQYDPAFLDQLVPNAIGVTLADGDKKTLNMRVK